MRALLSIVACRGDKASKNLDMVEGEGIEASLPQGKRTHDLRDRQIHCLFRRPDWGFLWFCDVRAEANYMWNALR